MLRVAVSVAGLVTIASPRAEAQGLDTLSAAQRAGLALARLGAGQRVRIHRPAVGRIEGWVVSSSPTLVTLRTDGSTIEAPVPGVDSLWVKRGTHAVTGALIGAALGGLALAMVEVGSVSRGQDVSRSALAEAGFLVGAAGGVLIGAFVGTAFPKWQLRVP